MTYKSSPALQRWLGERRAAIDVLEGAHKLTSKVTGRGRPLDVGKPVAHAYVLHVAAQFQGFVRDLHDLGALALVQAAGAQPQIATVLTEAIVSDRTLDRGNATVTAIQSDFRRLGVHGMNGSIGRRQPRWTQPSASGSTDKASFENLLELRNCLAHGNETELVTLRQKGVLHTVSWTRGNLPVLNRTASAMDTVVWDHFLQATGVEPWE